MADSRSSPFHELNGAEISSLRFERGSRGRDHIVELLLRRGNDVRTLRFAGVVNLRLGGGFPEIGWLQIDNVADRQLDGLAIRVCDGEQSDAIEFWAASVEEISDAAA